VTNVSKPRAQLSKRGTHPSRNSPNPRTAAMPREGLRASRARALSLSPFKNFALIYFTLKSPHRLWHRREKVTTRPPHTRAHAHTRARARAQKCGVNAARHPFADSNSVRHVCPSRQVARHPPRRPRPSHPSATPRDADAHVRGVAEVARARARALARLRGLRGRGPSYRYSSIARSIDGLSSPPPPSPAPNPLRDDKRAGPRSAFLRNGFQRFEPSRRSSGRASLLEHRVRRHAHAGRAGSSSPPFTLATIF